jgi:polysaccharide deacetylase family protein (PEP-CTERM system associated)
MTSPDVQAHHFTVDVEEYFHATALAQILPSERWEEVPRRSPALMRVLLDLLDARAVKGTFFVLGWLAEREPGMVREIAERGHEIASHGWGHQKVTELTEEAFREDVRRARTLLRELTGQPVLGYRAPSFSIVPGVEWAMDVLLEEGYRYDSSTFPVRIHPGYGYPDADPHPHRIQRPSGELLEFPPTTLALGGLRLPAAGGAYLRFFPLGLIRAGLRSAERSSQPGTFYVHPWEWDTAPPKVQAPALTRLRMTGGVGRVRRKLERLLSDFPFRPIRDTLAAMERSGAQSP